MARKRRLSRENFVGVAATNPAVDHQCPECGKTFTTVRYSARTKFCSKTCGRRAGRRNRRHMERAAERAGEKFTVREIADRDGWRCHLCSRSIPDRGKWTNSDDDPTIDHLIPLGSGGAHTRANVAIAHRICNSKRGSGGTAQLLLFA